MVIQPFVENAVKHGLKPRKGQGKVSVDFSVFDEVLEVSVDDDGVGRAAARALNERLGIQKSSKGMGITERRLELLRKAYGIEVRIEVEDKIAPDGQPAGTRVRIVLPKVEFDA
jgi:sensor histidine kinase YesM